MATLSQVAKRAGVSVATASIVLNPGKQQSRVSAECADRVRDAARKLKYVPNYHARSMKLGRADNIAVALDVGGTAEVDHHAELAGSYFGTIIGAVEMLARARGFQTTIVGADAKLRAPDRGLLGIRQRRFDGMVVPGQIVQQHLTDFLQQEPAAPVVVVEYRGDTRWPVVDWDEQRGVHLALEHLRDLGHRHVAWLGPERNPYDPPTPDREDIAGDVAKALGLRFTRIPFSRTGTTTTLVGEPGLTQLVDEAEQALARRLAQRKPDFTAVLAWNDHCGIGACGALLAAGHRIPQDISVVGFDDAEARLCIPRLTSVSHQLHEMGARAAEMLLAMIAEPRLIPKHEGRREILQPNLVTRATSGPAPAA